MNDVPETELLSAYLDGELTADEQVRVEQMLAAEPAARQTLEELRAVGNALQGLPQQKLDEDLSARVLEVAERRMLLGDRLPDLPDAATGAKPSAGRAAEILSPEGGSMWREISWRGMFSKRALIWSGLIVATAIIISFTSPPPKEANRDIAKFDAADKKPTAAAPAFAGDGRDKGSVSELKLEPNAVHARGLADKETEVAGERRKAEAGNRAGGTDLAVAVDRRLDADKRGMNKDATHASALSTEGKKAAPTPEAIAKSAAEAAPAPALVPPAPALQESANAPVARPETAAAPMAPAPPPATRIRPEPSKSASPHFKENGLADAPGTYSPAGAMAGKPAAPGSQPPGVTGNGGVLSKAGGTFSGRMTDGSGQAEDKRGPEKGLAKDAAMAGNGVGQGGVVQDGVAQGGVAQGGPRDQLANGSNFNSVFSNGNSSNAVAQAGPNQSVDQQAATYITFCCAAPAAKNKVFEKVLQDNGVASNRNPGGRNLSRAVQDAPADREAFRGGQQLEPGIAGALQTSPVAPQFPRNSAPRAEGGRQDNAKSLRQPSPEQQSANSYFAVQNAGQQSDYSGITPAQIVYQCDVSPAQLVSIVQQIKSRTDSFSALEVRVPVPALQTANAPASQAAVPPAEVYGYGGGTIGGGVGGRGSADRGRTERQSKADAGNAELARKAAEQPPVSSGTAPAAAAAPGSSTKAGSSTLMLGGARQQPGPAENAQPDNSQPANVRPANLPAANSLPTNGQPGKSVAKERVVFILKVVGPSEPAATPAPAPASSAPSPAAPAKQ